MPLPTERADVAIVGAGIVGSSLAYHLSRLGQRDVVVVDQGPAGSGTTGRSAGILTFQGWGPWDLALVRWSAEELRLLSDSTGTGDFRANGGLRVARTPEGAQWLATVHRELEGAGVPARRLEAKELDGMVPWADLGDARAALFTPEDATFNGAEAARAYLRLAVRAGVGALTEAGRVSVRPDREGWVVQGPTATVRCHRLVLAAGAGTKRLAQEAGVGLPVAPFRARFCLLRPSPLLGDFPTLHDLDLDLYARPAAPGRILVGDGTERREADPDRDDTAGDPGFASDAVARLHEIATDRWGFVAEGAGSSLCVASPDVYPLVGPVPGAPGLFVATGFNGFGAMRAPALAYLLARGIVDRAWGPLAPADPARFPSGTPPPVPDPRFPLEQDASTAPPPGPPEGRAVPPWPEGTILYRPLRDARETEGLELPHLSDWFDPFLVRFLADALRVGGTAEIATEGDEVVGVQLTSPTEEVGSVFTRCRAVARHYLAGAGPGGLYADRPWTDGGETITVMAADLRDYSLRGPVRNPVRLASTEDLVPVAELMREVAGSVDDAWLRTLPRRDELCFLCEIDGRVAGVSWATVAGRHARGHSFMVRPRYRGLGVGTDLLHARMLWLRDEGIERVISEIYEGNAASEVAAERAGMARVGTMFHYRGPAKDRNPVATSGEPRTSDRRSRSSR